MKPTLAIAILFACAAASAQTYVKPHVTKDGTYVAGHYRSAPNSTDLDNYSTKGNTNPYTGAVGTQTPKAEQPVYTPPPPVYRQPVCGYTAGGQYICR